MDSHYSQLNFCKNIVKPVSNYASVVYNQLNLSVHEKNLNIDSLRTQLLKSKSYIETEI